ncbi:MAG: metal ABC transporter permease [Alphaproteobacteria bacterium]|nr:metal ABC transporter permease [Alphaproteobacteria bacterium]
MTDLFFNPLVCKALLAGFGLALTTGPLGCFLVWRRMAFFGDALAHSSLLGVALGIVLHIDINIGIVGVCLLCATILAKTHSRQHLSADAWLGIISYSALALGFLALSKSGSNVDLESYLVGDILSIRLQDLFWIYGCALLVAAFFYWKWRELLLLTLDEELAQTAGVSVGVVRAAFMVILALTVAIALKAVGALLMPALLIMPAATAGRFARSPEQMAFIGMAAAFLGIASGLLAAIAFNTPSGPTIVVCSLLLFLGSIVARAR